MNSPALVVGAGWSGAVIADELYRAGRRVEIVERAQTIGGHSRVETINGVVYEPHGPHIFHTSNPATAKFLNRLGVVRPYRFCPLTEIVVDGEPWRLSWPLQVDELRLLPDWSRISDELDARPVAPSGDDFETYAVSLMGRRLYELFIEGYTRKQWGCEPSALSSSFAPRRIDLRTDGVLGLFAHERFQFFPERGANSAIESLVSGVAVTCGANVGVADVGSGWSAVVITAALDEFVGRPGDLAWRGVNLRSEYQPTDLDGTVTPAYVINRPSLDVPYTRTVETKHATGQRIGGTVVSYEYPGADAKHYPIPTVEGRYEGRNAELQAEVRARLAPIPVFFCGRLASYTYINQDQAIEQAQACAAEILTST